MMASLPTGSDKLLEIRTAIVDIVIKSKGKKTPSVIKSDVRSSSLEVVAVDVERVSVPIQGVSEEYHDHVGYAAHDYMVEPLFFEQTDYVVTIKARNGESLEFQSNSPLVEERIGRVLDDDASLLSGVVNFGNNVGFSDFIVIADGKNVLSIRIEVYPTKIAYKEDYQEMMADINNMVSESVLDFMKKTYQVFVPDHTRNEVPAVFFTVLQTIYDKYLQAINRIISVPHHKLISQYEIVPYYKAKKTDFRSEKWLQKHPEHQKRNGDTILVDRVLSARKQITYDTQENRLVKFMLKSTIQKINDFSTHYNYSKKIQNPDQRVLSGVKRMKQELQRILSASFFSEVSEHSVAQSMSLVFGMAPGYRELYKYYLMLQNGITVGGDIFHISVRETAQLYEYWCFIKLYSILKERYNLQSPDIIKVDRHGVTVDLEKGKESRIKFINKRTDEHFYLSYNPAESKTQTVNQKPDNVLELEKKGTKYKYIFDAKYRIENKLDSVFYPYDNFGPKVDDINTMHRYRDAIVYENKESRFTFEKTMFGAYILFPYSNEEEYSTAPHLVTENGEEKTVYGHRFYRSIENVNIGGLPFLPSATTLVTKLLDELISDSSDSAFERATLPVGIEDRIRTVDWKRRDVLIGLVPDRDHLDLFLNSKMYWTRRFDRDNLPIRYIALYEKGVGIRYFGELVSWRQEKRSNLPGHSKYGSEKYNVFEVLKWTELKETIKVEEAGPNPIAYTNYFLLSTAKTYSELRLRSEADYRFFIELKRRTDARILEQEGDTTAFESGNMKIVMDDDQIHVIRDDVIVGSSTIAEFIKKPNTTFRVLQSYIQQLSHNYRA